ncbi:MAG: hypothetical protein AB2653_20015 [Candidatus Thiodiazotropha endolucinida]
MKIDVPAGYSVVRHAIGSDFSAEHQSSINISIDPGFIAHRSR